MRSLALLFTLSAGVVSGGETLPLRVEDAETGKVIPRYWCGLVARGTRETYARFDQRGYRGRRVPRPGDALYVHARGYSLGALALGPEADRAGGPVRPTVVRLARSAASTPLSIEPAPREKVRIDVRLRPSGNWTGGPPLEVLSVLHGRGPWRVDIPAGMVAMCMAVGDGADIVWPVFFSIRPNRPAQLRLRRARAVRVKWDTLPPRKAEFFADRLCQPDAKPREIDAWRWKMIRPWWVSSALSPDQRVLRLAPDIPLHVFAAVDGKPFYRHLPRGGLDLDLTGVGRTRALAAVPLIDGRPAPSGTLVGPGRLDGLTLCVAHASGGLRGCTARLGPPNAFRALRLPAADWLTAWHPVQGLAHLRWDDAGRATGKTCPGQLVVRFPQGRATGWITVFRTWRGAGQVKTSVPSVGRHRDLSGAASTTFRGLPPGLYGVNMDLKIVAADGKAVGRVTKSRNVEVLGGVEPTRWDLRILRRKR